MQCSILMTGYSGLSKIQPLFSVQHANGVPPKRTIRWYIRDNCRQGFTGGQLRGNARQGNRLAIAYLSEMVTVANFRTMALSFAGTYEIPHFNRCAFRTRKRIFTTLLQEDRTANIRLSPQEQAVICRSLPAAAQPVPNKWGEQGWTTVHLQKVTPITLRQMLSSAHALASY